MCLGLKNSLYSKHENIFILFCCLFCFNNYNITFLKAASTNAAPTSQVSEGDSEKPNHLVDRNNHVVKTADLSG